METSFLIILMKILQFPQKVFEFYRILRKYWKNLKKFSLAIFQNRCPTVKAHLRYWIVLKESFAIYSKNL